MSFFSVNVAAHLPDFISGHGGRRQSWELCDCLSGFFRSWHARGERFYRTEKAAATSAATDERHRRFAWISVFLKAQVFSLHVDESALCVFKKSNHQTWKEEHLRMTDGDDHSLWREACVGCLTGMPWCLHYTPSPKPAHPLPLCFPSTIYTHVPASRRICFVTRNTGDV